MAHLFRRLFGFLGKWLSFCRPQSFRNALAWLRGYFVKSDSATTPKLSQHMQNLLQTAQDREGIVPDDYPPTLKSEDGPLVVYWISMYGCHYFTTKTAIKRQPHAVELGDDIYGNPVVNPYIAERIHIEAANLKFIAANTTIPVPKVLDLWQEHGLWCLKTSLVEGAIELMSVDEDKLTAALAVVEAQLESEILPQLRRLTRRFMGCADPNLPVVPPHRLWKSKDTRIWSSMPRGDDEEPYTFCHTDLGRQNIMVDPDTFQIVSIIDWETAGFFPASWELPLWKTSTPLERYEMTIPGREAELAMTEAWEREE